MQRKRIARSCRQRLREIPGDDYGRAIEVQSSCCQRGHVQRLANMARSVRTLRVLMEQGAAKSKKQQRCAGQCGSRSANQRPSKGVFVAAHLEQLDYTVSTLTRHDRNWLHARCDTGPAAGLTSQPFLPNLRLTKHMHSKSRPAAIVALLLGFIFLAAQFHFCSDVTTEPTASHLCPICSTAGSALTTPSLSMAVASVTSRLEITPVAVVSSAEVSRAISPRAPPVF